MPVGIDGHHEIDGLLMGPTTPYVVDTVLGMGMAEVRTVDRGREHDDGDNVGDDRLAAREIVMAVGLDGIPDDETFEAIIGALGAAMAPRSTEVAYRYQRFGRIRRMMVRPRGLLLPWDDDFHLGAGRASLRLLAPDPLSYSDEEEEIVGDSDFLAENEGNYPVWPVVTTAAGGDILLENVDTGESVQFTGLPGATVIDFRARTAVSTGTDVYGTIEPNPEWWRLHPGETQLAFSAAATITFRHGWTTG